MGANPTYILPLGPRLGVFFYATGAQNHKKYNADFFFFFMRKKQTVIFFSSFLSAQMSVGANQGFGSQGSVGSRGGFHGCLENLNYNGLNLIHLARQNVQQVIVQVMNSDLCGLDCVSQSAPQKRC